MNAVFYMSGGEPSADAVYRLSGNSCVTVGVLVIAAGNIGQPFSAAGMRRINNLRRSPRLRLAAVFSAVFSAVQIAVNKQQKIVPAVLVKYSSRAMLAAVILMFRDFIKSPAALA